MARMATPGQIAIIHTLVSKLHISDENYRDMLSGYNVTSSKKLSFSAADNMVKILVDIARKNNVYKPKKSQSAVGYATNAQKGMLLKMWLQVSVAPDPRAAFRVFIKNRWSIDSVEWLPQEIVPKIKKALEGMGAKYERS
jgi:hypothetical protein